MDEVFGMAADERNESRHNPRVARAADTSRIGRARRPVPGPAVGNAKGAMTGGVVGAAPAGWLQ